ncbi:hypothetical protein RA27_02420 [Ruegeria sp. ANG-R]|uniref:hypothetical protein n=1 Tax=Ruegeria sp. ANG-R TaxID=1577903 RepID=UPI00057C59AD|nr:hypothetical protein [Ruegeria sp. ANG-R]KIC42258.1 hypothetical protein RA27_02420 [Ruegeria sp. ANG-R]
MLNPTLKIVCHSLYAAEKYLITFTDGKARCHIWSKGPGEFSEKLHRNTPTGKTYPSGIEETHHTSVRYAQFKKYDRIRERLNTLSPAAFKLAREEFELEEAAKAEAKAKAQHEEDLSKLRELADRLGYDLVQKPAAA